MAKLTELALGYPLNLMEYLDSGKDKTKKAILLKWPSMQQKSQNYLFTNFELAFPRGESTVRK
jgi:hypothetical protein